MRTSQYIYIYIVARAFCPLRRLVVVVVADLKHVHQSLNCIAQPLVAGEVGVYNPALYIYKHTDKL